MTRSHAALSLFALFMISGSLCGAEKSALDTARETIAAQVKLLEAGDVDKLKPCFTERQQERITKENVEKGKAELSKYKLEDLVDAVEEGEYDGKKTIKIKMKNGRSLTTLMLIGDKWLADTIWFR